MGRVRRREQKRRLGELAADAGVALLTGAILGFVVFQATDSLERNLLDAQDALEEERFIRDVRRDNVRFVREVATQAGATAKPFPGLDLRRAKLAGLVRPSQQHQQDEFPTR